VSFNRNIVTSGDVQNIQAGRIPKALILSPPAWTDSVAPSRAGPGLAAMAAVNAGAPVGPGNVPIPTADDYLTKLVKLIPAEILGAYLLISSVITSEVTNSGQLASWLGYMLIGFAVTTVVYDIRVLNIRRPMQIGGTVVALGVYVFAFGGWFATTSWYHAWYATIVLPLFSLLAAVVPLQNLPTDPA
jgi:hypothetical protein